MDRRRFLQAAAIGIAALETRNGFSLAGAPAASPDLAIAEGKDIAATVRAAVKALGGIETFVPRGAVVLLKPNVSFPNPPELGSTTHPDVIRAVTELCIEAGAKRVIAVDYPMGRAAQCFERSGMNTLAASCPGLAFVELKEEAQFEAVQVPLGEEVRELMIAKLLRKAEVYINLPKAKSHGATDVSFGLKNQMGLFWNRRPFHQSYNLHNAISDLATVVRPHLTILDATCALVTNGPQGPGKLVEPGIVIAGTDPVAVDSAACGLADWNNRATRPSDVAHIARAAERGLGRMNIDAMTIARVSAG